MIEEKLRKKGFTNDPDSKVICRYTINNVVVDVMPTDQDILGFSNKWYEQAFATAQQFSLGDGYDIAIMLPEYLLATKLEAFKGRGKGDGRMSTDFEDIVFVLNNRVAIWQEMEQAAPEVRSYLHQTFSELMAIKYFGEWVEANLEFYEQGRARYINGKLQTFVEVSS